MCVSSVNITLCNGSPNIHIGCLVTLLVCQDISLCKLTFPIAEFTQKNDESTFLEKSKFKGLEVVFSLKKYLF